MIYKLRAELKGRLHGEQPTETYDTPQSASRGAREVQARLREEAPGVIVVPFQEES